MNWDEFKKWLEGKFGFQLMILGTSFFLWVVASAMSKKSSSEELTLATERRYSTLPKKCVCLECGYVVENPGEHCINLSCPICGGRMRRLE